MTRTLAWHFVTNDRKLRDGTDLVIGETLKHAGDLELCRSGLHASIRAIDALCYAPGEVVCLVECSGKIVTDDDKLVCTERTPLWAVSIEEELRVWARLCALEVVNRWNCPPVVRAYLESGDEEIRDAAWAAAWAAASAAARDAASAAARDAARDAASAAARDAASAAAWAAASVAAWAAARDAASAAAWAAARDAASAAARDAAWYAAMEKQNVVLESLIWDKAIREGVAE